MSFSSEVKKEMAHAWPAKPCCELAEAAGFLRTSGALKPAGGGEIGLALSTSIPVVARHCKQLFESLTGESLYVAVTNKGGRISSRRLEINLLPSKSGADLLIRAGVISRKDGLLTIDKGIPQSLMAVKCCRKSLLKGLFLGAGSVADPGKRYHFEIVTADRTLAGDVRRLMNSFTDIHAGVMERSGKYIVYLKAAEQIKDMLGIMDANLHLLAYEDARDRHELRGRVNRFSNCDNANLDRQTTAAAAQMQVIAEIEAKHGGLSFLPPKVREAAETRKANPEASFSEIGAMFAPPVSKTAAAARLKRLLTYQ